MVRRDPLHPGEITQVGRSLLTAPVRTAVDLARWAPNLTEKVVAVDTLAHQLRLRPQALRFAAGTVLYRPGQIVADVRGELRRRGCAV